MTRPWQTRCADCGQIAGISHRCVAKPVAERFNQWVVRGESCWEWVGDVSKATRYGRFWLQGRTEPAHRVAYELAKGPIPAGLHIDHLCRNRQCVNPDHLEAVTLGENVLRGESPSARNARKTHCDRGHLLSGDNIRIERSGRRACRLCAKERRRLRRVGLYRGVA